MPADVEALPFIDEHSVRVHAARDAVWHQLLRAFGRESGHAARTLVRLLGADPSEAAGQLPEVGATLPGFAVVAAQPAERLELAGRHRYAEYALVITLTAGADGRTLLAARSHARFPRLQGRVYRALVIDSRGHRVLVRRMLRAIARAAEAA